MATSRESLTRPSMPTAEDQARSSLTGDMHAVLDDNWDDILGDWLIDSIGEERAATWGPVDTSINDLGDLCRQLSTPGLYGRRPIYRHADPLAAMLTAEDGQLDKAGVPGKLQHVQYMALGLGDYLVRPHVDEALDLSARLVSPHNVYIEADQNDPSRPLVLWELRQRHLTTTKDWIYAWDCYSIRPDGPHYQVIAASGTNGGISAGDDLSNLFLATKENPSGDWSGERYPWRDDDALVLPFAIYRCMDAARTWNHTARRGAYRGGLNSALLSTYANQAARDASGTAVIAWGLTPLAGNVQHTASPEQTKTVILKPGAILYHQTDGGVQPGIQQVGPGANLDSLSAYCQGYSTRIMTRFGLSPSDVTRQSANPSSAAALMVSDRGRRDYSRQVEPLFRRSDLDLLRIIAVMYRGRGVPLPTTGYTIEYIPIPDSPAEQKERREQLTWESDQGILSPIDLFLRSHPGTTRDQAVAAIVQARLDRLELNEATGNEMTARNLTPPQKPAEPAE